MAPLASLLGRWYAILPWLAVAVVVAREFGWRRALGVLLGGWAIAFAAEWASTSGPGIPFGVYHYRASGLRSDVLVAGVPLFDSLSFTWLAFACTSVLGYLGARGWSRILLTAVAMVGLDLVVDPVALRGARWWLGSIYSYPAHQGVWYGVTLLNYVGWLAVGLCLALWIRLWLGDYPGNLRWPALIAPLLVAGVVVQSAVLAPLLGVAGSLLACLLVLVLCGAAAVLTAPPGRTGDRLIIACALDSEARMARRSVGGRWERDPRGGFPRWQNLDLRVEVWSTGQGRRAARAAAAAAPPGCQVVVAGVAGALTDDWAPNQVGVGRRVLDPELGWQALVLVDRLQQMTGGRPCDLASVDQVADTPEQRGRWRESGAELVDMEASAWAARTDLRVSALKVVLDTPSLPLGSAAAAIPKGGRAPAVLRVAGLILRRPRELGHLARLGRRQSAALGVLGQTLAAAMPGLWEPSAEVASEATLRRS